MSNVIRVVASRRLLYVDKKGHALPTRRRIDGFSTFWVNGRAQSKQQLCLSKQLIQKFNQQRSIHEISMTESAKKDKSLKVLCNELKSHNVGQQPQKANARHVGL
jgi:ribosomal protein L25 (general stress protein Ctc)